MWRVPRFSTFVLASTLVPAASVGQVPSAMNLARTSWLCTTHARLDDPPRQGYMYFHPDGDVKMAQVVPASNRGRANNILWWRTREDYNDEDPTGRKWTDLDWLDDGNIWPRGATRPESFMEVHLVS